MPLIGPLRAAVEEEWAALAEQIEFKLLVGALRCLADDLDHRGFKASGPSATAKALRDLLAELRAKRDAEAKQADEMERWLAEMVRNAPKMARYGEEWVPADSPADQDW